MIIEASTFHQKISFYNFLKRFFYKKYEDYFNDRPKPLIFLHTIEITLCSVLEDVRGRIRWF